MSSALDDFRKEMEFNIGGAELAESFTLIRSSQCLSVVSPVGYIGSVEQEVPVTGIFSDAWKREEKDGKLSPERPAWTPSIIVPLYKLLEAGISPAEYDTLKVRRKDSLYSVMSHAGADPVRFFLKGSDGVYEPDPVVEPVYEPEA